MKRVFVPILLAVFLTACAPGYPRLSQIRPPVEETPTEAEERAAREAQLRNDVHFMMNRGGVFVPNP